MSKTLRSYPSSPKSILWVSALLAVSLPFVGCDQKPRPKTAKPKSEKHSQDAPATAKSANDPEQWELADPRHEFPRQPADVPAPKLARNKQPYPPFLEAHRKFVEIAKTGNIDLVFFGDSITENWNEYPALWEKAFGAYKSANFGIGGDRTQHVLWRITNGELDGIQPKVAVLLIGTNNLWTDSPKQIAAGVSRINNLIVSKSPRTKILLLGILPRGMNANPGPERDLVKAANLELAKLADGERVIFQDIGDRYLHPDQTLDTELMPDFLHPSEKGLQTLAEAIAPRLQEWIK